MQSKSIKNNASFPEFMYIFVKKIIYKCCKTHWRHTLNNGVVLCSFTITNKYETILKLSGPNLKLSNILLLQNYICSCWDLCFNCCSIIFLRRLHSIPMLIVNCMSELHWDMYVRVNCMHTDNLSYFASTDTSVTLSKEKKNDMIINALKGD